MIVQYRSRMLFIITLLIICCCENDSDSSAQTTRPPDGTTVVTFKGHDNRNYHANLAIPDGTGPYPAVIVLHGCTGLYTNAATHTMHSHFRNWVSLFRNKNIVVLFVDSFHYPRGIDSFCSKAPMADAKCSPAYERPRDVADAIQYLSTLPDVDINRIGLLGFSQGAETVISAALNTDVVKRENWTVRSNGTTYAVPAPAKMPETATIRAAVAYYPGLGFYNYYGSSANSSDGAYLPVAPLLVHAAAKDPLYTNSNAYEVFVQRAVRTGAGATTHNQVELMVHTGANHSFDGTTGGADGAASQAAITRTIQWFTDNL